MTDRAINDLCPDLQTIATEWLAQCKAAGLNVALIVTWRSAADQDAAKEAGLSNAGSGESPHNCCDANGNPSSKAFDFACFEDDGTYVTNGSDPRYKQAGEIGKQLGLEWGGDWVNFPDYDHLQIKDWKSSS